MQQVKDGFHLTAQGVVLLRVKGLGSVAQGLVRGMVDLHHQAMGCTGNGGPAQWDYLVASPGGMAGVDNNRQMAFIADMRDGRQVQRVAAVVNKGPYPSFTQDDIFIAAI